MLQKLALALAITSAFTLAGCGGGGGDNGDGTVQPPTCTADQVLVDNTCQPKPPTCTADQILVNNTCQPKPITCEADEVLVGNTCQPKPTTSLIEVTAVDGYLHKAYVWLDCDADGVRDNNEIQAETNSSGVATLDVTATPVAANCAVGVEAKAGYTVDMDAPAQPIATSYNLWAPAGSVSNSKALVTPFSSLVKFQVSKGSTLAAAKTEVAAMLGVTEAQMDVDYIKLGMNEHGAIAANLVQFFPKLDFVGNGGWGASTVGSVVSEVATNIRTEFAKHTGESGDNRRKGIRVVVDDTAGGAHQKYPHHEHQQGPEIRQAIGRQPECPQGRPQQQQGADGLVDAGQLHIGQSPLLG